MNQFVTDASPDDVRTLLILSNDGSTRTLEGDHTGKYFIWAATAIAVWWLYRGCLISAVGYAAAIPFPSWWLHVVSRHSHGIMFWADWWQTVAIVVVALPFAWVIARYAGRHAIYFACVVTVATLAGEVASIAQYISAMSSTMRVITIFDFAKILLALPLFVWLLRRLPSNLRWSGP